MQSKYKYPVIVKVKFNNIELWWCSTHSFFYFLGEIDFLETAWTVDASATDDYRHLFNAQWNQVSWYYYGIFIVTKLVNS